MPHATLQLAPRPAVEIRRPVERAAKVYSASEALLPALRRTYFCLFRPLQREAFLKLSTVALLSEGFLVSFKFLVRDTLPFSINAATWKTVLLARDFLPVTILGAFAVLLAGMYCFYLVTYLRFGFFHSLIHQTQKIRLACRLYSVEAESLFAASLVVWCGLLLGVVLLAGLVAAAGYTVLASPAANGKLDLGNFLILFFPCIGFAFALILAVGAAHVVLNDLILPHMAVEGSSFKRAWAEVRTRIAANKETFLSFFLVRLGLPIFAGIVLALPAWLVGLAVFGLLDMSAAGFNAMLGGAPGIRFAMLAVIHVLFDVLGLVAGVTIAAVFGGPLGVFMRSYALFFYGSHFKALGNLLEPPHV